VELKKQFLFRKSAVLLVNGVCWLSLSDAGASSRGGDVIPINNPSFEANPVAQGCFAVFQPIGWTLYDPNGINDAFADVVGGINCDTPYFPGGAPDGEHAAIVFLSGNVGGGPMGLTQALGDALEANTIYTLTAEVGNIASGQGPPPCDVFGFFNLDGFPGYRVQLLAGGVVIAEDNNTLSGTIPEGEFRRSTVQVAIGAAHPQLGTQLEVRVINLNIPGPPATPGIEVDFDDVRLVTGCLTTGDLDDDNDVDLIDADIFVNVLIGVDTDLEHVDLADMNCSETADGDDVSPFAEALLN
jgi:hypothetical protein